jgi:6-phosphofructokinase 1
MKKKIGICTSGGDCSGLGSAIFRLADMGAMRGHEVFGITDGYDNLAQKTMPAGAVIRLDSETAGAAYARLSGSMLGNGRLGVAPNKPDFHKNVAKNLKSLGLDALVLIGGNGSISLAHAHPSDYSSLQLVCVPKTIDNDVPLTDKSIGFDTAVNELAKFADQLWMTARSHGRWFVVQTMGRDSGFLCLHAGLAAGAGAILIPESKWKLPDLIGFVKNSGRRCGMIFAAEGCKVRGRTGRIADIIAKDLERAGIPARAQIAGHLQRGGDTAAPDRIMAAEFACAAIGAVENNETFVMTALQNGIVKTIPISEMIAAGSPIPDPNISGAMVSNEFVPPDYPLVRTARSCGIFL